MAEGGGEDKENPFSFQSFIKKKKHKPHDRAGDDHDRNEPDIFEDPDIFDCKPVVENDGLILQNANTNKKKEQSKDENPFSFKKFLRSSGTPGPNGPPVSRLDIANHLPDFVQDHFVHDYSQKSVSHPAQPSVHHRLPTDVPLPDFALDSESCDTFMNSRSSSHESAASDVAANAGHIISFHPPDISQPQALPSRLTLPVQIPALPNDNDSVSPPRNGSFSMDGPEPDLQSIGLAPAGFEPVKLPDFLSDSAVATHACASSSPHSDNEESSPGFLFTNHVNGDASLEIKRLQDENRELRRQLTQAQHTADTQSRRITEITREKERIEKREAEDNSALEKMVQQVEANLVLTTQRAVAAENTITKLKQDVKSLQAVISTLRTENETLRGGQPNRDPVKLKAQHASEQLAAAAKNAEHTLKQLLSGVETIKMVSNVLASIDKITEESPGPPH